MVKAKRILKRIGWVFAILVALVLIINATACWWVGRKLDARIAELRDSGEPTSFTDLSPEPVPPDEDAAVLLRRVLTDAESLVNEADRIYGFGNEDPNEGQLVKLRECLAAYKKIFPVIHEASLRPKYGSQFDYTMPHYETFMSEEFIEYISDNRSFARALSIRSDVLLADGKQEDVLQSGLDVMRLSRHWDQEPTLVGYLVSLACRGLGVDMINRALRDGPLSDESRAALEEELALHDDMAGFENCLRSERAFSLDAYRNMSQGYDWLPMSWWTLKPSAIATIDLFDQFIAVSDRPWYKSGKEREQMRLDSAKHSLVKLQLGSLQATWKANDRARSHLRCLRTLNALQKYEERNGRDPTKLEDLGLPKEATTDPFNGQPLRWKKVDAGWLIYSVGSDGVDDGGKFDGSSDFGSGPIDWKPTEDK